MSDRPRVIPFEEADRWTQAERLQAVRTYPEYRCRQCDCMPHAHDVPTAQCLFNPGTSYRSRGWVVSTEWAILCSWAGIK